MKGPDLVLAARRQQLARAIGEWARGEHRGECPLLATIQAPSAEVLEVADEILGEVLDKSLTRDRHLLSRRRDERRRLRMGGRARLDAHRDRELLRLHRRPEDP